MLRPSILFIVFILGTSVFHGRARAAARATPTNGIFGWPLARITSPARCEATVTTKVQVPLFIVRTTTAWYGSPAAYSTQYRPDNAVTLTTTVRDVKTIYVTISPMYQTASTVFHTVTEHSAQTMFEYVPCSIFQPTSTTLIPHFTFATVTASSLQRQQLASMVTATDVSSQVVLVTKTEMVQCAGQPTSLAIQTITRTSLRFITRTFTDVFTGSASTTGVPVPYRGLPSAYLRF